MPAQMGGIVGGVIQLEQNREEEKQTDDLTILSAASMALVELSPEEDVYASAAERLRAIVGNCIVIWNSFDEASSRFCVQAIAGAGGHMSTLNKLLGRRLIGMSSPISDEARTGLTKGTLEKVPGCLYELSVGAVPRAVCDAIERLLSLGDAYAMGCAWRGGELFGSAIVIMRRGVQPCN